MSLDEAIGEIFLANSSHEERVAFSDNLRARFLVPDGGMDSGELSAVLLVESPHTSEVSPPDVNGRFPLAGNARNAAGRRVRVHLNEWIPELALPSRSIGRLVHERCASVRRLGIMNVSRFPMQGKAYESIDRSENDFLENPRWESYVTCVEYIRKAPDRNHYQGFKCKFCSRGGYLKDEINELRSAIDGDLEGRLEQLHERFPSVLLVCCGKVAQTFYERTKVDWPNVANFPHPSPNSRASEGSEEGGGWDLVADVEKQKLIDALSIGEQ